MDSTQFTYLMRAFTVTPTRRDVARALTGLTLSGALASAWRDDGAAKKKKRKKCGPCQTRRKGRCKGNKPDDAACNGDGRCFAGVCNPRPTCLGFGSSCQEGECCSGTCLAGQFCIAGVLDQPCFESSDCLPIPEVLQCVAYHCRQS
jgi:hypothetical protein